MALQTFAEEEEQQRKTSLKVGGGEHLAPDTKSSSEAPKTGEKT